jgi:N-acetylmuramoyl-L-alanine amidase
MRTTLIAILAGILFCGCTSGPYSATNKTYRRQTKRFAHILRAQPEVPANDTIKAPGHFVGTTNFSMRKPNFVIIHHTAQNSCDQTLQTFTLPRTEVSAHYVICRDGTVHHMLNDYLRSHHAGLGKWGNVTDMNSCSIGIELDNNGAEPFPDAQIASLISLLGQLKSKYNIPAANFIGHADYAPTRKEDPSVLFPWKRLAQNGFGLWYDEVRDSVAAGFNSMTALRVIGYDTKDSAAAIIAFKRHFMQESTRQLNETDKSVLNNLMRKY